MTSLFAVAFLGALPAIAQELGDVLGTGDLGQIKNDFDSYAANLRDYLTNYNNSVKTFQPLEVQIQLGITDSSGSLDLPNPVSAPESIRNQIVQYSISDKFETNPAIYGSIVSNEVNRYIIRGSADTLLGADGQVRLKNKLEATQNIVRNAEKSFQEAQAKIQQMPLPIPSNNDIMSTQARGILAVAQLQLESIQIQKDQSKLMAEMLGRTIQSQNDLQYTNLNLANISQQNEDSNRARRVEAAAEVARLLRVTSQTDLFRRSSAAPSLESPPPDSENNPPDSENSPPPVLEPGE
ncbi:hypothetical protein SD81_031005 [Tolypothrix campylonemoides VB511288]|nr:hypothetical protein SD81_031005 [Tolypothrix campylonemoides VB511288]